MFIADDVGVVEFLHDVDLLVYVLLQEGFALYMQLADDLNCVEHVCGS